MKNAVGLVVVCLAAYAAAYFFYSRFLAEKILKLSRDRMCPSCEYEDGIDYVPTRPSVLFGHHFSTIAGLGPIVGPAIGVIWGWLPALLWVVFGTIFLGAVHDLSTLYLSLRHQGQSIGGLTEKLIGPRARLLFLVLIFFILALAMGVFAQIMSKLFSLPAPAGRPEAVFPSAALIFIAMLIGFVVYKVKRFGLLWPTIIGVTLMGLAIWWGEAHPVRAIFGHEISATDYVLVLLLYSFAASVLPVWLLLQPRDYINSFQLFAGLALIYLGIMVGHPNIQAPAFQFSPAGAPSLFPFLFITIACGAISGFHNLVCSGTTARQIRCETDCRPIGYGAMLTEGVLAVGVIVACTAVVSSGSSWADMYSNWQVVDKNKLSYFIEGSGRLIGCLGVPPAVAANFIAVMCVSFAMTTLDSGTRLLRYNIEELGQSSGMPLIKKVCGNRYAASAIAIAAIGYVALLQVSQTLPDGTVVKKPVGMILWILFGTTNQLLAGLGLLLASLFLYKQGKNIIYTALPMVLVLVFTLAATVINLHKFWMDRSWSVFWVGLAILILSVWLIVEAALAFMGGRGKAGPDEEGA